MVLQMFRHNRDWPDVSQQPGALPVVRKHIRSGRCAMAMRLARMGVRLSARCERMRLTLYMHHSI